MGFIHTLLVVAVCSGQPGPRTSLAERYWDRYLDRYPTHATDSGNHQHNDRLEDLSEASLMQWRGYLEAMESSIADKRKLEHSPGDDALTLELLDRTVNDAIRRIDCKLHLMPLDPLDGTHIKLPLILVSHPFNKRQDFEDYVARLNSFPRQVDDLIANMRKGMELGYVPPRVVVERIPPQLRQHIVDDVTASEFYAPVTKLKILDESGRADLAAKIVAAITRSVVPAYAKLLEVVEREILPNARQSVGISEIPNGRQVYETLAQIHTTVPVAVDEIHRLGLAEVDRIRRAMDDIRKEVGFSGTLNEFIREMRTNPKWRFNSAEELVATADDILQRTKPKMKAMFNNLPESDCVMKEIESFRAASSPSAYYGPVPEDGSRPGYYYINTYQPTERLRFTLEALTYHESIPGHHFQIALDIENSKLPKFRRFYGNATAYVEGWALYSEKLGYEFGGYQTPYDRFGQLTFEMWRACRLVVDTGMHAMGWSKERAVQFMADNTSLSLLDIDAEVNRYITWPGQALAYKIGEIRILAIREKAEKTLGDRFDLAAFHDALLSGGAMAIDVLERRMDRWIQAMIRTARPSVPRP
ncbi:MAG: DUF885 domain-containing protein [Planctomycetota bacterium]|jgi:prolyl oligopeptidase